MRSPVRLQVFSSANATAQITTVIGTTGADGIATATLTNTVAGPAMWSPPLIRLTPISTPPLCPVRSRPSH
ncbi:putative Bacterial Ig-like domain protein [Yersinia pseudotuberculosis]|nr:putative Bacterial Ig-like domain protein [Yersinia pseudotuberculosis]